MAASYPTAVKSFTSKSAGDTIQPAHVNDLQDEVAAIEGGLLSGTAPLNSSRSTLAALSVTGGSTLGTLQGGASTFTSLSVSGASTLASLQVANSTVGNLTVSGGLTVGASTFTSLQAGNSTVTNLTAANVAVSSNCTVTGGLTVAGGSTLGTIQAGDSTLANLTVSSNCTVVGGLTVTGGSTLGALQVGTVSGGNSTLSNLQISSNCTITGNLVVTGTITGVTAPTVASYVQAKLTAAQTLGDTSLTLVNLEEVEDLAGEFDSTNHIFTPKSSGYYSIAARVYAGAVTDGPMTVGLYVNSSAIAVNRDGEAGAVAAHTYAMHTLAHLSSGTAGNVSVWAQAPDSTGVVLSTGAAWTALEILRVF